MCWPALAFSRTGQCGNSDSPHWPVPYLNFPHWPVRGNELGTGPVRGGGPRLHWPNPALASAGRGVRGRTGLTPHWPARRRPDPALAWRLVRIRALACLHQPVRRHVVATVVARNTSTDWPAVSRLLFSLASAGNFIRHWASAGFAPSPHWPSAGSGQCGLTHADPTLASWALRGHRAR